MTLWDKAFSRFTIVNVDIVYNRASRDIAGHHEAIGPKLASILVVP